jgi:hypothetical protein
MARNRPVPEQRSLFQPDPAAEVIASLHAWPAEDLERLVRQASSELLSRCRRALPIAAPVAVASYQALAAYPCAEAGV